MSTGKFHGETAATTPTGSWTIRMRFAFDRSWVEGSTLPAWRRTSSEARRKWSAVNSSISSRDSRIVLPTSREIICAISSLRSMHSVKARRQISTRSTTDVLRQSRNASAAACTAVSTCVGVDPKTLPITSPVAGDVTSISSPSPSTHSPPMNAPFLVVTAIVLLLSRVRPRVPSRARRRRHRIAPSVDEKEAARWLLTPGTTFSSSRSSSARRR